MFAENAFSAGLRSRILVVSLLLVHAAASAAAGTSLEQERVWIDEAARLVEAARSGAAATDFGQAVRDARAALRPLVRAGRQPPPTPAHRQLHSHMILLDVLLKSAAGCHEGGRIVCPAMLMAQLTAVLRNAREQWRLVAAGQSQ